MASNDIRSAGSFRDPSGFVFFRDETVFRQVNQVYKPHYDRLVSSGLSERLVSSGLTIPQQETDEMPFMPETAYKTVKPEKIDFISYPYEWCFSQLKDAALLTLRIQKEALKDGMSLKDASAYNIQFRQGKPVLMDTLSFESYEEGRPWVAYRQFCQSFLAPLALMRYKDLRLSRLASVFMDGVPLDMASHLLPMRTMLKPSLFIHIHAHAKSQAYYADKPEAKAETKRHFSRLAMMGLIDSLESAVRGMKFPKVRTEWGDYMDSTNYSPAAMDHKKKTVAAFLGKCPKGIAWDVGANTGVFSRIAAESGMKVISMDMDPVAVERNYCECKERQENGVLPLVMDLTNPSPGIGWADEERNSLLSRGPADTVLALALVHHLAISNNVPLAMVAEFFGKVGRNLIIEFVPKNDSQVQRLLASREDVFTDYSEKVFEKEFSKVFRLHEKECITDSHRILYMMERKA
jgi:hypothetical protein